MQSPEWPDIIRCVCVYIGGSGIGRWGRWERKLILKGFYKEALLKNVDYTQVQQIFKQKSNMIWFLRIYNRRDNWVARWRVDRKNDGNY